MALSREHWRWLRELVTEWEGHAQSHGNASELNYHDGKADGYREAATELEETLDAIASYYE